MADGAPIAWLDETPEAMRLRVHAVPGASRTELAGTHDGRLKLRLKARPVEGAANRELVRFLARTLGVPKSTIEIVSGRGGRRKIVSIQRAAGLAESLRSLPVGGPS